MVKRILLIISTGFLLNGFCLVNLGLVQNVMASVPKVSSKHFNREIVELIKRQKIEIKILPGDKKVKTLKEDKYFCRLFESE